MLSLLRRRLPRLSWSSSLLRRGKAELAPRISERLRRMNGIVDTLNRFQSVHTNDIKKLELDRLLFVKNEANNEQQIDLDELLGFLRAESISHDKLLEVDLSLAQTLQRRRQDALSVEDRTHLLALASRLHFSSLKTSVTVKQIIRSLCAPAVFDVLTASELVFLLHLMSEHHFMPLRSKNFEDYKVLPDSLAKRLEDLASDLNFNEIVIMCHSLYKLKLQLSPTQPLFTSAVFEALIDVKDEEVSELSPHISELFKMLRMRGSCDWEYMSRMMRRYESVMKHLSWYAKSRLLVLTTTGSVPNTKGIIGAFMDDLERHVGELREKDAEVLLFALYFTNFELKETQVEVLNKCLDSVIRNGNMRNVLAVRSHIRLLFLLSCFLDCRLIEPFLPQVEAFTLKANEMKKDFLKANSINDLVGTFRRLCLHFINEDLKASEEIGNTVGQEYVKQFTTTLVNLVDMNINLELQNSGMMSRVALDEELRRHLLSFRFVTNEFSMSGQVLEKASQTLQRILRVPVLKTQIMPTHGQFSLVFALKRHGQCNNPNISLNLAAKRVPQHIVNKQKHEIPQCSDDGDTQVFVMLVPKRSHFNGDGEASGPVRLHVRQLENLGFKVIPLRVYSFKKALRKGEEVKMFVSLIKNQWIGPLPASYHKENVTF